MDTIVPAMGLLLHFLVNAAALAFVAKIYPGPPGITAGGMGSILAIALVFGLVNALMLLLTAKLGGLFGIDFAVHGFLTAFIGALIIAIISTVFGGILHLMTKRDA
jgi:putative membrane protein